MTEPRAERGLVRYYCTAGNGMEHFLIEEVKRKLAAEDVCQMPGKVLFSSSAGINRVSELKAAERLFLLLKKDSPVRLSAHTSAAKGASVLQSRLLGDRDQWTSAVMTWSRLQRELAGRSTTVSAPSSDVGGMTSREEGKEDEGQREEEEEEEKCVLESRKSTGEQQDQERGNMRLISDPQNGARRQDKKRKRDDDENEDSVGETIAEKEQKCLRESKIDREEEMGMVTSSRKDGEHGAILGPDFMGRKEATPGLNPTVESNSRRMDDTAKGFAVEVAENDKVTTTTGKDETQLQPSRIKPDPSTVPISFRISCKCTGSLSRYFNTQDVNKLIGVGLSRLLGWRADLKNPELEVNVHLSDDDCLLGIPLTRLPLANRSYIKTTGLRSTVAWAMASLAQIQPGFCVVDPMCGVGTILIEAALEHKAARFIGVDIDGGQLQKAHENVEFAELGNRIHLLRASSMALPLPSASVDAVVCDLPFGRKFGTKTNMAANLPLILTEMERVLRIGGTLVLLLSPQLSCLMKKHLAQKDTGSASNQETKTQTGTQVCPSPLLSSTELQTFKIHQGINSPPTQETGHQSGPQQSLPRSLSSLKHQATHRVSLGMIDGLIHKYVKTDS